MFLETFSGEGIADCLSDADCLLCPQLRRPTGVQRTAALGFAVFGHFERLLWGNRTAVQQLPTGFGENWETNFAATASGGFVRKPVDDDRFG